jgi:hypothetical protein
MIDIDEQLQEVGRHWRGEQSQPTVDFAHATAAGRRPSRALVIAATIVVIALIASAILAITNPDQRATVRIGPRTPVSGPDIIDVGPDIFQVGTLAVVGDKLWVSGHAPGNGPASLKEIDAATGKVVRSVTVPDNSPFAMAVVDDTIWLRTQQGETSTHLLKISAKDLQIEGSIELQTSSGLAVTRNAVWALDEPNLRRIDPSTLKIVATIPLPGGRFASGSAGVWLESTRDGSGSILRVDESDNTLRPLTPVGPFDGLIAQLGNSLWVVTTQPGSTQQTSLSEVSTADGSTRQSADLGRRILDVASDGHSLWVVTDGPQFLTRIDPATGAQTPVTLPGPPELLRSPDLLLFVASDAHTGTTWVASVSRLLRVAP